MTSFIRILSEYVENGLKQANLAWQFVNKKQTGEPLTILQLNIEGQIEYVNKVGYEMMGYSQNNTRPSSFSFAQLFDPLDRECTTQNFNNILEKKEPEVGWVDYIAAKKWDTDAGLRIGKPFRG